MTSTVRTDLNDFSTHMYFLVALPGVQCFGRVVKEDRVTYAVKMDEDMEDRVEAFFTSALGCGRVYLERRVTHSKKILRLHVMKA